MRNLQRTIPAFTFDQTAEPVGPTAGQTWRERSAGGLILGEWEWSGSLWKELNERRHMLEAVLRTLSNSFRLRFGSRYNILIESIDGYGLIPADFNTANYGRITSRQTTAGNGGVPFVDIFDTRNYVSGNHQSLARNLGFLISTAPNTSIPSNTYVGIDFTYVTTGTTTNLPDGVTCVINWRYVRR